MKKFFLLLVAGLVPLVFVPASGWSQSTTDTPRTWTDDTGQHAVQATLVSYDTQTKQVVLQRDDGREIRLVATDLCMADRRYLALRAERLRIRQNRQPSSTQETAIDQALTDHKQPAQRFNIASLYGIDWHRHPQSAQWAATGQPGARDDKPIVWFRVLGDLSGFM